MKIAPALLLTGALSCASTVTWAIEILQWQRLPLAVPLHVGQERIIFVDQNVRVGIPQSLKSKLRIQSNGGALYLRPNDVIEPSRIQLQNIATGEIILVDIDARPAPESAALEPVQIVRAPATALEHQPHQDADKLADLQTPVPVVLTRYAAQNLYAPLRTLEPLPGVSQVRVTPQLDLGQLLPALPIRASVLGAWQLQDYWVTALLLRNDSARNVPLDPRELNGDFYSATFQHRDLGPAGTATDSTAVYIVTKDKALPAALFPAMSSIDASVNLPAGARSVHEK